MPVGHGPGSSEVFDDAEVIGVADEQSGRGLAFHRNRPGGAAVGAEWDLDDQVAGAGGEGAHGFPPCGVDPLGDPHRLASGGGDGQVHRLDAGGGAVIERGVGNGHAGEAGDDRLVLEQRLEHALGDLWLVWRIGGYVLGSERHPPHHRGHVVVVGAAAGEAHEVAPRRAVGPGEVIHAAEYVGFGERRGDGEGLGEAQHLGDRTPQFVEAFEAAKGQHPGDLVIGVGVEGGHGVRPPCAWRRTGGRRHGPARSAPARRSRHRRRPRPSAAGRPSRSRDRAPGRSCRW